MRDEKSKHPLLAVWPTILDSFEAWFSAWQQARRFDEFMGLLHLLTTGYCWENRQEFIITLLDVADGFRARGNFTEISVEDNFGHPDKTGELRHLIAQKAFSILCARFFRNGRSNYDEPDWWWMLQHQVLFEKVLWFLRTGGIFGRMVNRTEESNEANLVHQHEVFCGFMRRFARLGWDRSWSQGCERFDDGIMKAVRQRLEAARPVFLRIFGELGELWWLGQQVLLDDETVAMLTELALSEEIYFQGEHNRRRAKTLNEAILGGSVPAQLVVLEHIKDGERKRVAAERKKADEKRLQEARAAKLKEIEKDREKLAAAEAALKTGK